MNVSAGPLLQVRGLVAGHGGAPALHGVDLAVEAGHVVALLGTNGAGRTTLLRAVSGLLRPMAGEILLSGRALHRLSAAEVVRAGVAHVPEGRRVFGRLSVHDNLLMGAYATPAATVPDVLAEVLALLPVLAQRSRQAAGTLSGGEQQLLSLGRALMSRPRLLLLDEPTTGLAPQAVEQVLALVAGLAQAGTAVLLVEQDLGLALAAASHGVVLATGRVMAHGTAEQLAADPAVARAYLGE